MIIISQDAINDISTFYANTLLAHPNTWTQEMVDNYIEFTIKEMESIIITSLQGQKTPILNKLNNVQTAELLSQNQRWYFSVVMQNENAIIENAWHYSNASNRAYRRGKQNPTAPLSLDDRSNQEIMKDSIALQIDKIITETLNRFLMRECIKIKNHSQNRL